MKVRILIVLALLTKHSPGQGTLPDYQRASKFLGDTLRKYIYNRIIDWNAVDKSNKLVYLKYTERGREFVFVDYKSKTKKPAFDHVKFATALSLKTGKIYSAYKLPFSEINFDPSCAGFRFKTDSTIWKYSIADNTITFAEFEKDKESEGIVSPDGKQMLILSDFNLKLKNTSTGQTIQITENGNESISYGTGLDYYAMRDETAKKKMDYQVQAYWSPDSKKIIIPKFDRTHSQYMPMINWAPEDGLRPHFLSNERALPGDTDLTYINYLIYDGTQNKLYNTDIPRMPAFLMDFLPDYFYWTEKNDRVYTIIHSRGYNARTLMEIDLNSGSTRKVLTEESDTYVDIIWEYFNGIADKNEFIWMSEKDGWNHLYLYDLNTGKIKNQITKGEFVVREVKKVDAKKRKIYFMASGKEDSEDIYYQHLYVVNFDGSGMQLLTPEKADHEIFFLDETNFLDAFSTPVQPTTWVIKNTENKKKTMELEKMNISGIEKLGWKAPTPFKMKARDGVTDIYGIMYKPANFDSTKKYPVIDHSYSGPYRIRTPKNFEDAMNNSGDNPLSQLGFIVVNVDGLGTAYRSKKIHDFSYKNLGDIGSDDHVKAIRELAVKCPYIDTSRVGIMGHSHGGYDAVRALILHPEFYKVAVSSAGCHDFRLDKEFYPELYMGLVDKHYDEQSNIFNASKIKGKLLLLHGGIDNNCNMVETMRLVSELEKQNKDFDLIIVPGDGHGELFGDPYAIRKRWDFFVRNLLGVLPPKEFRIF